MNKISAFIVIMVLGFSSLASAATVTRVLDGDTVEVTEAKQTVRVRLVDIDAPEKAQPYGQKSKQHLLELVKGGGSVMVQVKGKDRYGRVLGRLWLKECSDRCVAKDAGAEMVKSGLAWAYRYKGKPTNQAMQELEKTARDNRLGLWQDDQAVEPWKWRQEHKG
ncbi:thermonuclease family protein [Salmonella enterica]|nr:thermonuclease family protein [Salmonella enterica]ELT5739247.1 thermonuclease family protein [Salmonella enterica]